MNVNLRHWLVLSLVENKEVNEATFLLVAYMFIIFLPKSVCFSVFTFEVLKVVGRKQKYRDVSLSQVQVTESSSKLALIKY